MLKKTLLATCLMSLSAGLFAQNCVTSIDTDTPLSNFTIHGDGTVTDKATGLMWSQCPAGLTYNASTNACDGSAAPALWNAALDGAETTTLAGYGDWRLPNIKEMISLVEYRCESHALNSDIFPFESSNFYWTSTPSNLGAGDYAAKAWAVNVWPVASQTKVKNTSYLYLLVRDE